MSDPVLGNLVCGDQHRDAIHIAILPVIASEELKPGEHVGLVGLPEEGKFRYHQVGKNWDDFLEGSDGYRNLVGIIDPYLRWPVRKGQQCYLCLYPRSVVSLRHAWTHPLIADESAPAAKKDKASSERWLRDFVENSDCPDYDTLIAAATGKHVENVDPKYYSCAYVNDGEYLHFDGRDAHSEIPPEFWDHVEIVTGVEIPKANRAKHFSCSC